MRIYHYTYPNRWLQLGQNIDGKRAGDASGWAVSLSTDGQSVAIGAPAGTGSTGTVRVYRLVGGTWDNLFAILGRSTCAEELPYGKQLISYDSEPYLSTAYGNVLHRSWIQTIDEDGDMSIPDVHALTIIWNFRTYKTLSERFEYAVRYGELVDFEVHVADGPPLLFTNVRWYYSDNAGPMTSRFRSSFGGSAFSSDDGAWGTGRSNSIINGDSRRPDVYYGVGNFAGAGDTLHCGQVQVGPSNSIYYPTVRTYLRLSNLQMPRTIATPYFLSPYRASLTFYATVNTVNEQFYLCGGYTVIFNLCSTITGRSCSRYVDGDTFLRLYKGKAHTITHTITHTIAHTITHTIPHPYNTHYNTHLYHTLYHTL